MAGDALITPPLPEELWARVRELQTQRVTGQLTVNWLGGKVMDWEVRIKESSKSGRQGLRLQMRHKHRGTGTDAKDGQV